MLASEYGWTKDYILFEVYPVNVIDLAPHIKRRQLNAFIDLLQVQVITDSNLKPEDRTKAINAIEGMRGGPGEDMPERKFDRAKFEALRAAMGRRKGRAPVRAE